MKYFCKTWYPSLLMCTSNAYGKWMKRLCWLYITRTVLLIIIASFIFKMCFQNCQHVTGHWFSMCTSQSKVVTNLVCDIAVSSATNYTFSIKTFMIIFLQILHLLAKKNVVGHEEISKYIKKVEFICTTNSWNTSVMKTQICFAQCCTCKRYTENVNLITSFGTSSRTNVWFEEPWPHTFLYHSWWMITLKASYNCNHI